MNADDEVFNNDMFDTCPKIFKCCYKVYGSDSNNNKITLLEDSNYFVIALNVQDAIKQIEKDNINIEFNQTVGNELYHTVSTEVNIYDVEMIGPLATVTDSCLKMLANDYEMPNLIPEQDYLEEDEE